MSDVGLYLRRMVGRDPGEEHRASTPLELLFDLCFVVAVAAASTQLHHGLAEGHWVAILQYAMVFFAIWWAWMNFTWFASAYDTDDVPYRLLTLLQIAGGLVLAAGVPNVFHHYDFAVVTVGYVVMRVAMVGQWLRAAREDPAGRGATLRYAAGVSVVQLGWVLRLLLPGTAGLVGFLVLLVAELTVPAFAEARGRETPWHPGHINERYGLFTLIVLGECVSAAAVGVQSAITDRGLSTGLLVTAGGGLVLLFAMWWLYFKHEATAALKIKQSQNLLWGYSHYVVFASVAAVGSGLTLAADGETPAMVVAFAIAVPTCLYLVTSGYLHGLLLPGSVPVVTLVTVLVLILATAAVAGALGLPASVVVIAALVTILLVVSIRTAQRAEAAPAS
ncbi:membrane protein [Actinocatenispora thailandica]|uniref:Membrane protein n=1 Tax=Actinocatenispora thailandica TaxID=227318 RepID=A0A7R7DR08_9ACTN|nr:low temperature requirement protein A [Actinocatenispora thailandica]BCJ36146.1 membrane protein [Actinocatenispora thailandica]